MRADDWISSGGNPFISHCQCSREEMSHCPSPANLVGIFTWTSLRQSNDEKWMKVFPQCPKSASDGLLWISAQKERMEELNQRFREAQDVAKHIWDHPETAGPQGPHELLETKAVFCPRLLGSEQHLLSPDMAPWSWPDGELAWWGPAQLSCTSTRVPTG